MNDTNFYLYCITSKPENGFPPLIGHGGGQLIELPHRDIFAVAGCTPLTYYEPTLENLECHERVVSELMKVCTVLPMSFSTICTSKEQVENLLRQYYDQFSGNLSRLEGKVELGLKVFYRLGPDEEEKKTAAEDETPKDYMMRRYERYLARRNQLDAVMSRIDLLHAQLSALACESSFTKPVKNNLIFNASYLVAEYGRATFDEAVEKAKITYPEFKLLYSGPWPTYHFVRLKSEGDTDEQ